MPPKRRPRNEDSKDHRGRCRNRYQRWKRSKSNDDPVPERVPDKRVRNQKHTAARIPDGHGRTNERSRSSLTSSSTQGQGQDASASNDIPGFYYDPEKKKYFRIQPGQSAIQGAVTVQSIKAKLAEKKRQEDLMEIGKNIAFAFVKQHDESACLRKSSFKAPNFSNNLYCFLDRVKSGYFTEKFRTPTLVNEECIKHTVTRLKPAGKLKLFENPVSSYEKLEHMLHMKVNEEQNKILCLWGLREQIVQRIQMLNVNGINRFENGCVDIDISPTGAMVLQSFSKVTDMCWAPLDDGSDPLDCCILYTTTCFLGNNPSLVFLRRLDADSSENYRHAEFNLGQKATWACAWSGRRNQLSVGSEGGALLVDVPTRRTWELHTGHSDVRSQVFSSQGEPVLFSGTKKGMVYGHDLRTMSSRCAALTLKQRSCVCHLRLPSNPNHLYAADFGGMIKQWDLRQKKVVLEFKGNNQYSRTPFHIDPTEAIICSAGEDCYTRLWDVRDGRLLQSVPPPHAASRDTIPATHLFTLPNNTVRQPGLLMGSRDELHFYSFD